MLIKYRTRPTVIKIIEFLTVWEWVKKSKTLFLTIPKTPVAIINSGHFEFDRTLANYNIQKDSNSYRLFPPFLALNSMDLGV